MRHSKGGQVISSVVGALLNTAEQNTAKQGALPALQAATDPDAKSGDHYGRYGCMEIRGNVSGRAFASKKARDEDLAKRLWDKAVELTGVGPDLPSA